jgi:hypothetical protein
MCALDIFKLSEFREYKVKDNFFIKNILFLARFNRPIELSQLQILTLDVYGHLKSRLNLRPDSIHLNAIRAPTVVELQILLEDIAIHGFGGAWEAQE